MTSEETRRRIVDAVVELHQEMGPAFTTISAVAARAGVQRLTVYRHFPDERALIQACSAHWSGLNPSPDPSVWAGIPDPRERSRTALIQLYRYFRQGAPMLAKVIRDADEVAPLKEVMDPFQGYLAEVAGGLAAGWGATGERQRLLRAAAGLGVRFETWRSLADEGLSPEEAAALMEAWLACVAEESGPEAGGAGPAPDSSD
jgi:AcrR family transcriptional regulator